MKKVIAAVAFSTVVHGASAEITYLGTMSCGSWVQAKQQGDLASRDRYRMWVVGFLSGSAIQTNRDVLEGIDEASLSTWVDNYCQKHPLEKLVAAADALFDELSTRKLKRK